MTSIALIRLLAAEQQWLRLPPLDFEIAAELLSQVCVSCLEQVTGPPWLRVQALMVMSAAVPRRLVNCCPGCWTWRARDAAGGSGVARLLRLLSDRPATHPLMSHNFGTTRRSAAITLRTGVPSRRPRRQKITCMPSAIFWRLRITASWTSRKRQAAWERLREDLVRPVVRHRLEAKLLLVRGFVEDLEGLSHHLQLRGRRARMGGLCPSAFRTGTRQSSAPSDILAGDFVADWLGPKDQRRLLTLARPALRADGGSRQAARSGARSVAAGETVLASAAPRAARSHHLVEPNIPCCACQRSTSAGAAGRTDPVSTHQLGLCVKKLLCVHQAQAAIKEPERGEVEIFCPKSCWIRSSLMYSKTSRNISTQEAVCRLQIEYLRSATEPSRWSCGTLAPSLVHRRGAGGLSDKLRPFGGSLTGQILANGEWTLRRSPRLPLWHGG